MARRVTLHVLIWGTAPGACDYYRGHLYEDVWRALGVETRFRNELPSTMTLTKDGVEVESIDPADLRSGLAQKTLDLQVEVDVSDVEWADVIVFRRTYNTAYVCAYKPAQCAFWTTDRDVARAHPHPLLRRDTLTKPIWNALMHKKDKGILYDTDDLLIGEPMLWNGLWVQFYAGKELALTMARHADLTTVSTPRLAHHYRNTNPNLRVIRNAVDFSKYAGPGPVGESRARALYYGGIVRLRDFGGHPGEGGAWRSDAGGTFAGRMTGGYAAKAVRDNKNLLRMIWLGADNANVARDMRRAFDEVHAHVPLGDFPQTIANLRPDIGLAPLWGDEFDRCKSELHWLEYSAAGAATVAERLEPFDVIKDGADGLLARGRQQWYDAVRKLARNPNLRADIAAAAKERIAADYSHIERAKEWADAFQWVSEHRGIGADRA